MKPSSLRMLLCVAMATLALCGCVERRTVVVRERGGPPPPPPDSPLIYTESVVVREAPPAPQIEVIAVRPSHRHVWLAGHWYWRGGRWIWVRGSWVLPPRAGGAWVPGHWAARGVEWVWVPGHWRY